MSARDDLETRRLVRAIMGRVQQALSGQAQVTFGNVTRLTPLTVKVDGQGTVHVQARNASYAPALGDRVLLHFVRGEYVVAHKLMAT